MSGCYAKVQGFPSSSVLWRLSCFHFMLRKGIQFNTETCKEKKNMREVGSEKKLRFGTRQYYFLTCVNGEHGFEWEVNEQQTTSLQGLLEYW